MPAHLPKTHCPSCGAALGGHAHRGDGGGIIGLEGGKVVDVEDARRRIAELEAQVRILSDKATAAGEFPSLSPSPSLRSNFLYL